MSLNVIFVMRVPSHFSSFQSTLTALLGRGHRLTIHVDPIWSKRDTQTDRALTTWMAQHPEVKIDQAIVRRNGVYRTIVHYLRELLCFSEYCIRPADQIFYINRWRAYLPKFIQRVSRTKIGARVCRSALLRKALRTFENAVAPVPGIVEWMRINRPDIVVASPVNMRFSEEVEYIKAAKSLGIRTVVPFFSWDNLTTKGLFYVMPDIGLAWHSGHYEEAKRLHSFREEQLVITGAPVFDKWLNSRSFPSLGYEEFYAKVGLDADKPFVLFLGSSANIAQDESWLVKDVQEALKKSSCSEIAHIQMLFRPHPANWKNKSGLTNFDIKVHPSAGALPDDSSSFADFNEALDYAVCAIGINTSGMVDAVVKDIPVIAIKVQKYSNTQTNTPHFQRLEQSGALYVAKSCEEVVKIVEELVKKRDPKRGLRKSFVQQFIRPRSFEHTAGEIAAYAIEHACTTCDGTVIDAEIDAKYISHGTQVDMDIEEKIA